LLGLEELIDPKHMGGGRTHCSILEARGKVQMATRDENERTVEILAENFPKTVFIEPRQRRPLSPNIKAEIAKDIAADPDSELRRENVDEAVDWYKSHYGYHKACAITGASCVDLKGNVVATVTANAAYQAKQRVKEINDAKNEYRPFLDYRHNNVVSSAPPPPKVLTPVSPPPSSASSVPSPVMHRSPLPIAPEVLPKKRGRPLGSTKRKKLAEETTWTLPNRWHQPMRT
jgi:ProQ/FINO family